MRYTEHQVKRYSPTDKSSLIKFMVLNVPTAPIRICTEISSKILFLGRNDTLRIFTTATIFGIVFLIPDIVSLISSKSVTGFGMSGAVKLTSAILTAISGYCYNSITKEFKDIEFLEEGTLFTEVPLNLVEEITTQEQNSNDSPVAITNTIDLSKLMEEPSCPPEAEEVVIALSHDRINTTDYPSDQMQRLIESRDIPYCVKQAYTVEADYLRYSSTSSIEDIGKTMYTNEDCVFGEEDEALDFNAIEDLLLL